MESTHQAPDLRRKWLVMAAVGSGVFLATIDGSIVNVALPTFVRAFDTQFALVQWVVLSYMLTIATLMLSVGRLADMIGKKRIYAAGFVIFTVGSMLCGIGQSVYWLIGFRVLQAIGAAMMMALGTGIVTEAFPASERGKAMGTIGAIVSIGIITGPTLGGLLLDVLSWHWIFFVNVPIGIIGMILVLRFVPDTRTLPGQRFDFWGASLLFFSLGAFLLALTLGQGLGFRHPTIQALFAIWIILFILFLNVEFKIAQPMVDMTLFRNKLFSLSLFTGFITFVSMGGTIILMPFYLENTLGYVPRQVGLLLAVVPISAGIVSPLSGMLSDRLGSRRITLVGLIFLLLGYCGLTTLGENTSSLGYILRFLPIGLGTGIFSSPNNSAIMGAAPPQRLGIVSSLLSLTRTLGQTSGIAAIGAFWASRVAVSTGNLQAASAHQAPAFAQVAGLRQTFQLIILIMVIALSLSIWALIREQKRKSLTKIS